MKCEKCGNEANSVEKYQFYYGNYVGSQYIDRRHSLTKYKIAGSHEVFLCQNCVGHFIDRIRLIVSAGLVLLGLAAFLIRMLIQQPAQGSEADSIADAFAGLFIIVIALLFYFGTYKEWRKEKNRSGFGDQIAIRLHKKELRRAGFRKFFTRARYEDLQ